MAEQKWLLSSIVGTIVLMAVGSYVFYNSDYKYLIASMPDKEVFILKYDSGDKVEVVTRSSVCDYALFRITKDELVAKCGYRNVLSAKWYLEYFKTYGEDEWIRLQRKSGGITLDVLETQNGYLIRKVTPYYATASRTGTAGNLIETYDVSKDKVKSSLEFQTSYKNRDWRVIWNTKPNVEVLEDSTEYLKLSKSLNVFFSDALFDYRIDNDAFYKQQPGNFRIDPLLQFGNLTGSATIGTFAYGFCLECQNEKNISFKPNSSAFSAEYTSGWMFSSPRKLSLPENASFSCSDLVGSGYCEISLQNGTEIIGDNETGNSISHCLFNQSLSCFDGRSAVGSGHTFNASGLMNYDGVLIDEMDTLYLGVNVTTSYPTGHENATIFANDRLTNYTINMSQGSIEMMVSFK